MRDYTGNRPQHAVAPPVEVPPEPPPKPKHRRKLPAVRRHLTNWRLPLAIVVIAAIAFLSYGYAHTKSQLDKLSNPKVANETATQQTIDKVGKLVQLPSGETPTLATVNNAAKLKNQIFFADSHNGDKVLIYSKAGKAVLYRPSINKVIEYSAVDLGSTPASN